MILSTFDDFLLMTIVLLMKDGIHLCVFVNGCCLNRLILVWI